MASLLMKPLLVLGEAVCLIRMFLLWGEARTGKMKYSKIGGLINQEITVTGGGEKTTFSVASSYLTQDGIVGGPKANFRRYTNRVKSKSEIFEDFNVVANLLYTGTNRKTLPENSLGSVLFNALNNAPTFAVKERNGEYTLAEGLGNEVIRSLAQVENNFNQTDVNKISGKLGASYVFLNDFTAETSFQFNYAEVKGKIFIPTGFYGSGKGF